MLAKEAGGERDKLAKKIEEVLLSEHDSLYAGFEAISTDNAKADKLGLPKKTRDTLVEIIGKSIKPSFVEVTGYLEIKNYSPDGIKKIKDGLAKSAEDAGSEVEVTYISAPFYRLKVKADQYKKAEKTMKDAADSWLQYNSKHNGEGAFHREMPK
jgi:translation initiation factor 2 subunit 1